MLRGAGVNCVAQKNFLLCGAAVEDKRWPSETTEMLVHDRWDSMGPHLMFCDIAVRVFDCFNLFGYKYAYTYDIY